MVFYETLYFVPEDLVLASFLTSNGSLKKFLNSKSLIFMNDDWSQNNYPLLKQVCIPNVWLFKIRESQGVANT